MPEDLHAFGVQNSDIVCNTAVAVSMAQISALATPDVDPEGIDQRNLINERFPTFTHPFHPRLLAMTPTHKCTHLSKPDLPRDRKKTQPTVRIFKSEGTEWKD